MIHDPRFAGPDCGVDGCQREVGHIGDHRRVESVTPLSIDRASFGLDSPWLAEEDVPVTCRCSAPGCVCERVDPELNWNTSSLLVCQECCLERHRYKRHRHVFRCESCGKPA